MGSAVLNLPVTMIQISRVEVDLVEPGARTAPVTMIRTSGAEVVSDESDLSCQGAILFPGDVLIVTTFVAVEDLDAAEISSSHC